MNRSEAKRLACKIAAETLEKGEYHQMADFFASEKDGVRFNQGMRALIKELTRRGRLPKPRKDRLPVKQDQSG